MTIQSSNLQMLIQAAAETSSSRRERKELLKLAESIRSKENRSSSSQSTISAKRDGASVKAQGIVQVIEHIAGDPILIREYLETRKKVVEGYESLSRIVFYPLVVLLLAGISLSVLAWSNAMVTRVFEEQETSLGGFQRRGISWGEFGSSGLGQSIPMVLGAIVLGAFLIRLVGGPLAWARVEGSLPWIGMMRRAHSSAELFRIVSILSRANLSLDRAFELAGKGSEHRINLPLSIGISRDLRRGRDFVETLAARNWFPGWLVEYVYAVSHSQSHERTCYETGFLLDVHAETKGAAMVRILPQLLFCIVMVMLQYGYVSLVMRLVSAIAGFF